MTSPAETISSESSLIPADLRRYAANPFDPSATLSDQTALTMARAIQFLRPLAAAELESRVLINQPAHGIAWKLGLPSEVITQYEQESFPVRGRLEDREWVQQRVFARPAADPLPPDDVGLVLRWIALQHGVFFLEPLLAVGNCSELAEFGVSVYLRPETPLALLLKLLVAAACEPVLRTSAGVDHVRRMAAQPMGHCRPSDDPQKLSILTQVIELLRAETRSDSRAAKSNDRPCSAR